jgi:hypothetical protein
MRIIGFTLSVETAANREDLKDWVYHAVEDSGGQTKLVTVAQHIWRHHQKDLEGSGDLFYTWQYEMRWAAQRLRDEGRLTLAGRDWALKR